MKPALRRPVICVVTRARGASGSADRRRLLDRLSEAAAAGASMIQVRERHLDDRQLLVFLDELSQAISGTDTALVVNDRTDMALAAGLAGVHLKSHAPSVADVRRLVPEDCLVGRSVHSVEEAVEAERHGGDYLVFGTVFRSASKPEGHPIAGTAGLAAVCRAVSLPVVAIGGITIDRARDVLRAGAAGAAAIGLFAETPDMRATVEGLRAALTPVQPDV